MSLMDAPAYDPRRDNRNRNLLIAGGVLLLFAIVLALAGYIMGHGWFFSNLGAEHKVDRFLSALEARDYPTAYGIYNNDPNWQQHPGKYSGYSLQRFTEDWTTQSYVKAPIASHHVDVSRTDGNGAFGSSIIVAAHVNGDHKIFFNVMRSDGSITCCSVTHEIQYGSD